MPSVTMGFAGFAYALLLIGGLGVILWVWLHLRQERVRQVRMSEIKEKEFMLAREQLLKSCNNRLKLSIPQIVNRHEKFMLEARTEAYTPASFPAWKLPHIRLTAFIAEAADCRLVLNELRSCAMEFCSKPENEEIWVLISIRRKTDYRNLRSA